MKKIIYSALFITLISCQGEEVKEEGVLSSAYAEIDLIPQPSGIEVLGVPKLKVVGSDLVLLNPKDTTLLKIFDKKFNLLGGFLALNEFPTELTFPKFSASVFPKEDGIFSVFDIPNSSVLELNYQTEDGSLDWQYDQKKIEALDYFPMSILLNTDTLKIYVPEVGGPLVIENSIENIVRMLKYEFSLFESISPPNLPYVFQSSQAVNLEKGLIAIAPIMTGELEIYDFSGSLVRSTLYDDHNHDKEKLQTPNFTETDLRIQAVDILATEKSIYVLSANYTLNRFLTGLSYDESQIFQFNWQGDLQAIYNLNILASSFGVDERAKRFYVTAEENDDEPIWYFDY